MSRPFTLHDYHNLAIIPLRHKVQKDLFWGLFGFVHVNNLNKLPDIHKRLDELRETINDIGTRTDVFQKYPQLLETMLKLDVLHQTLIWKCFGDNRRKWENLSDEFYVRQITVSKCYEIQFHKPYRPKSALGRLLYVGLQHIHRSEIVDIKKLWELFISYRAVITLVVEGNYVSKDEWWIFVHLSNIETYLVWLINLVTGMDFNKIKGIV